MMHEFVTYSDGTLVVSSDIRKKENGFDTIIFELPSYNIVKQEGNYSKKEIEMFKSVVERGASYFFETAQKREYKEKTLLIKI